MRKRPDQIINGFDSAYYLLTQPDVAAAGIDPLQHFLQFGAQEGRQPDGLFSPAFYLANSPDVAAAGINPLTHYFAFGAREGRNPSALFNQNAYLQANPDVAAAGVNPLQHYLEHGAFEGRLAFVNLTTGSGGHDFLIGTGGDDTLNGLAGNDFVIAAGGNDFANGGSGTDTVRFAGNLSDYTFTFAENLLVVGGPEGHDIFANFERFAFRDGTIEVSPGDSLVDELYYYASNPDVWAAGVDAAEHYAQFGWHEGRNPNQYFDTNFYLAQNPDVAAAGVNPLEHYLQFGASEGRNPSALFDTAAYLAANPDVAAAGVNPLLHFLNFGRAEGRSALGQAQTSVLSAEDEDHVFTAGEFNFGSVDEILSVTIDASGITSGTLFVDANDDGVIDPGEALSGPGNVVSFPDIDAGRLVFRPAPDGSGDFYGKFSYSGTDGSAT